MAGYIPDNDAEKIQWMGNFTTWLNVNGASHGINPTEVNDMLVKAGDANTAVANNTTAQAAAKASTANKNQKLGDAIAYARELAQRIQNDPNTTDADRAAAGLTVRDVTPTQVGSQNILGIAPPLLLLDFSVRRQVTIHWGPNPANEHQNARPAGTIGCEIQAARGGIPADEALWTTIDLDSESPLIHTVNETAPTTYAYRACYVGKNLKRGPHGDPAVCTVSV